MAAANQVKVPGYPIPADDYQATQDRSKRRRVNAEAEIRVLKLKITNRQASLHTLSMAVQKKMTEIAKIDEHVLLQEVLLQEINEQRARVLAAAGAAAAQQLLDAA